MVVGYLVSLAVVMPASGWISSRVGAKPTFLAALGLWLIVVCAHFWSRRREHDEFREEFR